MRGSVYLQASRTKLNEMDRGTAMTPLSPDAKRQPAQTRMPGQILKQHPQVQHASERHGQEIVQGSEVPRAQGCCHRDASLIPLPSLHSPRPSALPVCHLVKSIRSMGQRRPRMSSARRLQLNEGSWVVIGPRGGGLAEGTEEGTLPAAFGRGVEGDARPGRAVVADFLHKVLKLAALRLADLCDRLDFAPLEHADLLTQVRTSCLVK